MCLMVHCAVQMYHTPIITKFLWMHSSGTFFPTLKLGYFLTTLQVPAKSHVPTEAFPDVPVYINSPSFFLTEPSFPF